MSELERPVAPLAFLQTRNLDDEAAQHPESGCTWIPVQVTPRPPEHERTTTSRSPVTVSVEPLRIVTALRRTGEPGASHRRRAALENLKPAATREEPPVVSLKNGRHLKRVSPVRLWIGHFEERRQICCHRCLLELHPRAGLALSSSQQRDHGNKSAIAGRICRTYPVEFRGHTTGMRLAIWSLYPPLGGCYVVAGHASLGYGGLRD